MNSPCLPPRVSPFCHLLLVLAAIAGSALPAASQPSASLSLGRAVTSFTQQDAPDPRQSTVATVDVEHQAASDRLRLFYSLDAGSFATEGDWTYYLHTAGATWRFGTLPEDGKPAPSAAYVGGSVSWRANGTSWAAADYRALSLFANLERHPSGTSTFRTGYRLDARDFPDFPELDQVEHDGFASFLVSFRSRTTLIVEAHAGAKAYQGGVGIVQVETPAEPAGSGRGRGMGMGPSFRLPHYTTRQTPGELSGQVSVLGRVAQSLADRTGLSLQLTRRHSFGGLPTAVVTTPALFFDDGVYDDPFASQAFAARAGLKHVATKGIQAELIGAFVDKDYRGMQALDPEGAVLAGGGLREDRIWRAGTSMTVPLMAGRTGPLEVALEVDYWFTRHRSNDAFYNYRSHVIGVGVTVGY